jgi:hypothetical protein
MQRTPTGTSDTERVLPFRARGAGGAKAPDAAPSSPVEDVGKYERSGAEERDDYAHRMLVNAAGLAMCGFLILTGVWIANKMADVRRVQDCALSGRRNCAPIDIADPVR